MKLQYTTINLPGYIFRVCALILLASFFIHFVDIREQKRYEKRIQISVDNTVNDLRYEIKLEIRIIKDKNNIFIKQNIAFLF